MLNIRYRTLAGVGFPRTPFPSLVASRWGSALRAGPSTRRRLRYHNDHRADLVDEFRDPRLTAGRIGALLPRRDRSESRLGALQVRENAVVDAVGAAVLRLEGADTLVTLRARFVVQFERARLDARICVCA